MASGHNAGMSDGSPTEDSDVNQPPPGDPRTRKRDDALTRLAMDVASGGTDSSGSFAELDGKLRPALARMYQARVGANRELAEDLAQRAIVGVWEALRTRRFDPTRASISTYAYAVAHRVWLVHARKASRTKSLSQQDQDDESQSAGTRPSGIESAERDEDVAAMLQAVRACVAGQVQPGADAEASSVRTPLTDEDRWLLAAIGRGVTDRELAKRLKIAPSSAHARKRSALAALGRALAALGFTSKPVETSSFGVNVDHSRTARIAERGGLGMQSRSEEASTQIASQTKSLKLRLAEEDEEGIRQ